MSWRSIGKSGDPWPAWLVALQGRSGVYAVREGRRVVYVGESHSGRLYGTLTRHFQAWGRNKPRSIWQALFGSGTDPGRTYDRDQCQVRVLPCRKSVAVEKQWQWIDRLNPRDNETGARDAVPF